MAGSVPLLTGDVAIIVVAIFAGKCVTLVVGVGGVARGGYVEIIELALVKVTGRYVAVSPLVTEALESSKGKAERATRGAEAAVGTHERNALVTGGAPAGAPDVEPPDSGADSD